MWSTVALVTLIFIFTLYKYKKNKRFWHLYYQFYGNKPLPIVGNGLEFATDSVGILKTLVDAWERYGNSDFRAEIGSTPYLMLCEVDSVEAVLDSVTEINKTDDYSFFTRWLGNGLLLSTGKKWHARRKIITPAFHFKILEQFVSVFEKKGRIFVERLQQCKGSVFNIYPFVTLCTLDVISESTMGVNIDVQQRSDTDYVKAIYSISQIIIQRAFSFWKRSPWLYVLSNDYWKEKKNLKIIHDLTNKVIKSRKAQFELEQNREGSKLKDIDEDIDIDSKKKYAFLDLLLLSKTPEGLPLSNEDIREEVDTFMFEGHDTTSSCISFALYLLAQHPEIQKKAFLEQLSIFGNDRDKHISYSDTQNMKYLERVIKESLRLYPAVPFVGRAAKNDVPLKDGKIIPAGAQLHIDFFLLGRSPKYWNDPMKFDPDRFLQENTKERKPFVYVPFSAGPRNCIGQKFAMLEIKCLLSKVLRNFELSSGGESHEPQLMAELILKSKNGINLILNDRIYNTSNTL